MRNARTRTSSVDRLRLAVDCMPVGTREAMLAGLRSNERIIAGAYVDDHGGVCPMLAAHRGGARTDFLSFAKSWDRFARARVSRQATRREVAILVGHLEASLAADAGLELDRAIREHRELRSSRLRRARRLLEGADPRGEMVARRLGARRTRGSVGDNSASAADRRSLSPVSSLV